MAGKALVTIGGIAGRKCGLPDKEAMPPVSRSNRLVPTWVTVLIAMFSVLLMIAGGASYAINNLESNITVIDTGSALTPPTPVSPAPNVDPEPAKEAITLALLGSDTRSGQGKGYGTAGGARADTTLIVHINAERTHAAVVSIPRDLWIKLPDCQVDGKNVGGYSSKFNAAYAFGGPECAVKTISENFGIPVQHVIVADFKGFKTVVNALGGVEVCLAEPIQDKSANLDLPEGRQIVSGEDALAFVRARKNLADGSDISRNERQKMFLGSIIRTAEQTNLLTDPVRLYEVLNAATKSLSMNKELANVPALSRLALEMRSVGSKNIQFVSLPWKSRGDGSIALTAAAQPILEAFATSSLPILDPSKKTESPDSDSSAVSAPTTSATGRPTSPLSPSAKPTPAASALGFDASRDPCANPVK